MAQPVFLVVALALALFAALALVRARRLAHLGSALRRMRTRTLAEPLEGLVRIRGSAATPQPLLSAFQRRPVLYYAYRVEDHRVERPKPRRLAVGKDWAPLLVESAGETAQVDARAALIQAPHAHEARFGRLDAIPETHREFFEAAGITDRHVRRFQDLRVIEYTLEPGDEVHVLGRVRTEDGRKIFYRATHSPLAVTAAEDAGLAPGLRHELTLFSVGAGLLLAFACFFAVAAFA